MASNPAVIPCAQGAWTLVATGVTTGVVHVMDDTPDEYLQTYRVTLDPVPTLDDEGVRFDKFLTISANAAIDVYVWCVGTAGSVRVDL